MAFRLELGARNRDMRNPTPTPSTTKTWTTLKPITNGPVDLGFDYFYGFCGSLDMAPYVYIENRQPTTTQIGTVPAGKKPGFWRAGAIGNDFNHQNCRPI